MSCPICGKPVVTAFRPFCSKRCADVDLGRWLGGEYVIPGGVDDAPVAQDDLPEPASPGRSRPRRH